MEITVIASGSNGNCCLVEEKDLSILIDAGKSGREIESRLNSVGKSMENIDCMLITHSHNDHVGGAGVLSRRFSIPMYITKQAMSEAAGRIGRADTKHYTAARFRIKGVEVTPVATSHSVSSCGFIIGKFGIFTDTGCVTSRIRAAMPKLKTALIESNHDIGMVETGPYPYFLKKWILSDSGHLSNEAAAGLVKERGNNLSQVLLGHLSGNNNTPEKAREAFETSARRKIDVQVCSREKCSGVWSV